MRKGLLCTFAVAVLAAGPVLAGNIDSDLQNKLDSAADGAKLSVLVHLESQVDLAALDAVLDSANATIHQRGVTVVKALLANAQATQADLANHLEALQANGRIDSFEAFWIDNSFRVDATAEEIRELANFPGVGTIYFNYEIELIEPVTSAEEQVFSEGGADAPEWGVTMVKAPQCWTDGYDGTGVLVSNMDTGVFGDPNVSTHHRAIKSRWAGGADPRYAGHPEWAWYDPRGSWPRPNDANGHGTHTMGTICGGAPGDQVGVAPGALWIAAAPIDRVSIPITIADARLSFQWFANPDKNPDTTWDIPDTMSNSWGLVTGHGVPPCDPNFWTFIDACEAVGTVVVFSAGNEGSSGLRRPADRAQFGGQKSDYDSCAVASNNSTEGISSFSSRGPTTCTPDGSQYIKPNICAPGENVRSCARSENGYTNLSGTSMASPHINGVCAIIRQACPNMEPDKVKDIIYRTARDKGTVGKDNSFGWGIVDAYAALQLALAECKPLKLGDMNCDGVINFDDINAFVLALQSKEQYEAVFPNCNYLNADCNSDGKVDFGDVNPFVDLLGA